MRLVVIRHAVAMDRAEFHEASGASDDLRPLTLKGARKMRKNTEGLKRLVGAELQLLVSSPLIRAVQTAEIVSAIWDEPSTVTAEELRPDADPSELATWLNARSEAGSPEAVIAVIGHEPHLSHFIGWLLCGSAKSFVVLKKGAACCFEIRGRVERGKGRLLWFMTPSQLRTLA